MNYAAVMRKKSEGDFTVLLVVLIVFITIFSYRVIDILSNNKERGGFAYIELFNFGVPLVESVIYDEGNYAENKMSMRNVVLEAAGLNKLDKDAILRNELSIFKQVQGEAVTNTNLEGMDASSKTVSINPFTLDEGSIFKVDKTTESPAYNAGLKKTLNPANVEVLIYHTHTTENYAEAGRDTLDEGCNVVGVGDVITDELENNYGIAVIHDKTNHSESYNDSYARSRETVQRYLKKYGDFKIVLDLHRDSGVAKEKVTTSLSGENLARIMFVNARNSERYSKNVALAEFLNNKANELFPGLSRGIYTYNRGIYAFNQSYSDGAILIECGTDINTMQEAQNTGKYIARLLAEYINK